MSREENVIKLLAKLKLLTEEVKTYKNFLETANNEWIVKGFIDVDKNI